MNARLVRAYSLSLRHSTMLTFLSLRAESASDSTYAAPMNSALVSTVEPVSFIVISMPPDAAFASAIICESAIPSGMPAAKPTGTSRWFADSMSL